MLKFCSVCLIFHLNIKVCTLNRLITNIYSTGSPTNLKFHVKQLNFNAYTVILFSKSGISMRCIPWRYNSYLF